MNNGCLKYIAKAAFRTISDTIRKPEQGVFRKMKKAGDYEKGRGLPNKTYLNISLCFNFLVLTDTQHKCHQNNYFFRLSISFRSIENFSMLKGLFMK